MQKPKEKKIVILNVFAYKNHPVSEGEGVGFVSSTVKISKWFDEVSAYSEPQFLILITMTTFVKYMLC